MENNPGAAIEVNAIAQLARDSVERHSALTIIPDNIPPGVSPRLIWPDKTITDMEGALPRPLRKRATVSLKSVLSFIDYINKHKVPGTAIHGEADEKGGSFCAIVDYHEANTPAVVPTDGSEASPARAGAPAWSEHTVRLKLDPTVEWQRWLAACGKDLDQRAFAEFIEDNAPDVVAPEGVTKAPNAADLMQLATTLQIKTDIRFASAINLQNGQIQLRYEEMINGSWGGDGALAVPQSLYIAVAPFHGGSRYAVMIRLRYRGASGKASFRMEMERPHKVVEAAFNDTKSLIEDGTGIKVWIGSINTQSRPNV